MNHREEKWGIIIKTATFPECFLCALHCSKRFMCLSPANPQSNSRGDAISFLFSDEEAQPA